MVCGVASVVDSGEGGDNGEELPADAAVIDAEAAGLDDDLLADEAIAPADPTDSSDPER
jgi:hypothetical protein